MIDMIKKMKTGDFMVLNKRFLLRMGFKNKKFHKLLIAVLTFILLFFICIKGIIPEKYNIKEGDIAPKDIKAPRDFTDEIATKSKIDKVLSEIDDQYNKSVEVKNNGVQRVTEYFDKAVETKKQDISLDEKISILKNNTYLKELSKEDYIETLKLTDEENKTLKNSLVDALSKVLSQDIKENNEDDLKKAQENLSYYVRNNTLLTKIMRELAVNIGVTQIKPNLFFDKKGTEEYKNQIKKEIEPVIIKKNQNIVMRGEVITADHIYLMNKAGLLKENFTSDFTIFFGIAALIIAIEILISLYIYRFRMDIYNNNSKLLIISIVLCISALFSMGGNVISSYLIPAGLVAMLMVLIFDPMLALVVSVPSTVLTACVTNFNMESMLIYLIGCISGVLFIHNAHQRNNILFGGLFVGIINGVVISSIGLINNADWINILFNSLVGLVGGVLSSILAIGMLPVFEQMSDIITPIKLMELSNPNQPLLQKMLFEAPGTYHHSILVGNLAETAANDVGANALLARTGSYYHDIGKIKRPYFFKENQITNDNPHDKITPKLSALIITSHVKDGLELASEYRLPKAVRDIIQQHHGTTLVKYFYVMAMKDGEETVEEASFRYDGPSPTSKEAAIVMMADSVEAGVRSLSNPVPIEIEKMVNKIVDDKVNDGQLDNCDLTLKDIERVKKAFLKVLGGIFHSRIEYPELKSRDKEGKA